jgi:hypothetical protein
MKKCFLNEHSQEKVLEKSVRSVVKKIVKSYILLQIQYLQIFKPKWLYTYTAIFGVFLCLFLDFFAV